jgi:hypothetical protein
MIVNIWGMTVRRLIRNTEDIKLRTWMYIMEYPGIREDAFRLHYSHPFLPFFCHCASTSDPTSGSTLQSIHSWTFIHELSASSALLLPSIWPKRSSLRSPASWTLHNLLLVRWNPIYLATSDTKDSKITQLQPRRRSGMLLRKSSIVLTEISFLIHITRIMKDPGTGVGATTVPGCPTQAPSNPHPPTCPI